ncbi:MAG TPA: hypothetical protein ENI27_10670 [bacterium]|nr:hypothetical protein [bacterium]
MGNHKTGEIARYVILHDPTNLYSPLNTFSHTQFEATLLLGNWPTGSVWYIEVNDAPNHYAIVCGIQGDPQYKTKYNGQVNHFWPNRRRIV